MTDISKNPSIKFPPKGLGIFLIIGPSIVWCSEYIGSGEVILATRTGAILGLSVLWAVFIGVFLKYWIGMSGARYTACTGEGMIDMFSRIPGPKNWAVWIVLFGQLIASIIAIASLASAAGIFLSNIISINSKICGWLISISALLVVWSGKFHWMKYVMSILVIVIIIGTFYVTFKVFPGFSEIYKNLVPNIPKVPEWAIKKGVSINPWNEILPLIGWGAGGFASQVWYSYWIIGAGYGNAFKSEYGKPADEKYLKSINENDAKKIKKWCNVVYIDATVAMIIGTIITMSFVITGSEILRNLQIVPKGEQVAISISKIFSSRWGNTGGFLFLLGGTASLLSTQIGQLAGWPRLLADSLRICIPYIDKKLSWKMQFRIFLLLFFTTSMVIIYTFGYKPVYLVKTGAILDGLLLTPLQAILIMVGLYFILPKLYNQSAWKIIKPSWIFALGLVLAFLIFGYFCIFQVPRII